jgi:hypothetical protein
MDYCALFDYALSMTMKSRFFLYFKFEELHDLKTLKLLLSTDV